MPNRWRTTQFAARLTRVPALVAAVSGLGIVFSRGGSMAGVLHPFVKLLYRATLVEYAFTPLPDE
jgi:hypothetical protein